MQLDNETMRELLHSTLAEKLEHLRGVAKKKKKPLGRKLKVLPGESYTAPESEAEEDEDEELQLDGNDEEEEATLDSPDEMEESDSEELPELTSVRYRKPQAQAGGDKRILELTLDPTWLLCIKTSGTLLRLRGRRRRWPATPSCSTWTGWGPTSSSGGRSRICCAP